MPEPSPDTAYQIAFLAAQVVTTLLFVTNLSVVGYLIVRFIIRKPSLKLIATILIICFTVFGALWVSCDSLYSWVKAISNLSDALVVARLFFLVAKKDRSKIENTEKRVIVPIGIFTIIVNCALLALSFLSQLDSGPGK